jgi:hypothetical protein
MATIITAASVYDQKAILFLLDELTARYPDLPFAYIILDRGYDTEEIHQDIYEHFGIIPIIIHKKMVYPESFTKDGFPFCPWGTPMKPKGIEYDRRRTKYACFKACQESELMLPLCDYLKEQYRLRVHISHVLQQRISKIWTCAIAQCHLSETETSPCRDRKNLIGLVKKTGTAWNRPTFTKKLIT